MRALITAFFAALFVAEVVVAGFVATTEAFAELMHWPPILHWGLDGLGALAGLYLAFLFFRAALAEERSLVRSRNANDQAA